MTQVVGNWLAFRWLQHPMITAIFSAVFHKQSQWGRKVESCSDKSLLLLLLFLPKKRKACLHSSHTISPLLYLRHVPIASLHLHSAPPSLAALLLLLPHYAVHPLALLHSLHIAVPTPPPLSRTSLPATCL